MAIPYPEDEARRVAALHSYEILDTEPELEFDALARLAAHVFDTPIGVVALLDSDRLWFKSRVGLELPELDRRVAFCAYAIMDPDRTLVVPDLRDDPRFCDNPLVLREPFIRSYAGAPIVDLGGYAIGTIAVIDTRPREFAPGQCAALKDLSSLATAALRGRRRAHDLERLAMTDYLTGIANRAQLDRAIAAEMNLAGRSGQPFSVLCLDLDGFKSVNDIFGHAAGDEVLRQVARRMSAMLRQGDSLARVGGDEFAIVMRNGGLEAAEALARRIITAVQAPITLSGGDVVEVSISAGCASYATAAESGAVLLAQADQALYETKRRAAERR